jgi:hypothetical protein
MLTYGVWANCRIYITLVEAVNESKAKGIPVHNMNAYRRSRTVAPLNLISAINAGNWILRPGRFTPYK